MGWQGAAPALLEAQRVRPTCADVVRSRKRSLIATLAWFHNAIPKHGDGPPEPRYPQPNSSMVECFMRRDVSKTTDMSARQRKAAATQRADASGADDPARDRALDERRLAGRREKLRVRPDAPPFLIVESPSGFSYRVQLRGAAGGAHSCDCPDFEANRLHTCKHVERVRIWLRSPRTRLPRQHAQAAILPRIYLHFGESVEPRLFGRLRGTSGALAERAFDADGIPKQFRATDDGVVLRWLAPFEDQVEPHALDWLRRRAGWRPSLPRRELARLLPALGIKPYAYQWTGADFLARTGRALLADERGLGKTIQAILAAAALRRASQPVRSVTVVCPASLRGGGRKRSTVAWAKSRCCSKGRP